MPRAQARLCELPARHRTEGPYAHRRAHRPPRQARPARRRRAHPVLTHGPPVAKAAPAKQASQPPSRACYNCKSRGISSAGEHLPGRQGVRGSNPRCSTPHSISGARRAAGFLMPIWLGGTQKGTQSAFEYRRGTGRHTAAESNPRACQRAERRRSPMTLSCPLRDTAVRRGDRRPRQHNGCGRLRRRLSNNVFATDCGGLRILQRLVH